MAPEPMDGGDAQAMFLGEHQHTLDAKGRVSLPAKFRTVAGVHLIVAKGLEGCLYVYPAEEYRAFLDRLTSKSDFDPSLRRFRRFFTGNAVETDVDSAGRITLSQVMRDHAELSREVAVVGNGDRVELWDAKRWAEYNTLAADNVEGDAEAVSALGMLDPGEKPSTGR